METGKKIIFIINARPNLLMASSIHGVPVQEMVAPSELQRIGQTHPALFMAAAPSLLDG